MRRIKKVMGWASAYLSDFLHHTSTTMDCNYLLREIKSWQRLTPFNIIEPLKTLCTALDYILQL